MSRKVAPPGLRNPLRPSGVLAGPFCVRFVFSPGEVKLGRLGWGEGNPGVRNPREQGALSATSREIRWEATTHPKAGGEGQLRNRR